MATQPVEPLHIIEQFGPHRAYSHGLRLESGVAPDRVVQTHCCFCGQQCGIQLKVKDNQVIGFEPWEEFPFNHGMLCPKGVKRYLQGSHPDRLLHAYRARPASPSGFRPMAYDAAIAARRRRDPADSDRPTGRRPSPCLRRRQSDHEKAYLMGKFARVCLKTPYIDYNGRLCMVCAGAGKQEGLRHRPGRQPLGRHPQGRRYLDRGRQRRRVRPDHDQLRLAGSRAERRAHHRRRSAHHPPGPHLRPVPADQARPGRGPVQRHPAPDDRERLARPRLHPRPHRRLRQAGRARQGMDAEPHRRQ